MYIVHVFHIYNNCVVHYLFFLNMILLRICDKRKHYNRLKQKLFSSVENVTF